MGFRIACQVLIGQNWCIQSDSLGFRTIVLMHVTMVMGYSYVHILIGMLRCMVVCTTPLSSIIVCCAHIAYQWSAMYSECMHASVMPYIHLTCSCMHTWCVEFSMSLPTLDPHLTARCAGCNCMKWQWSQPTSSKERKVYIHVYFQTWATRLGSMLRQLRLMYRQNIALSKKCKMSIDGSSERCECYMYCTWWQGQ